MIGPLRSSFVIVISDGLLKSSFVALFSLSFLCFVEFTDKSFVRCS